MSDLATLGARLRAIAAGLPDTEVSKADRLLGQARAAMTAALRDSVEPAGTDQLDRSREHLERVAAGIRTVVDRLDDYLADIGLATVGESPRTSTQVNSSVPGAVAPGGTDWWRRRINEISDGDATTSPQEVTVTTLFAELVDCARRGDRDGYRERLLVAGATTGPKLSGLSWPVMRRLAADVLGHTPAPRDDSRLRGIVSGPVKRLLPKLPDDVVMAQLHGACSLPHQAKSTGPDGATGQHPVDIAAVGPALVAALHGRHTDSGKGT